MFRTAYSSREVHPVGQSRPSLVDVRILATTNADLGARGETPTTFERRCIPPERRCSSVAYGQYAPSSRLLRRASHRSRCYAGFHHGLPAQRVREQRFRKDLFYRLNIVHIHIPPLRERCLDVPALVRYSLHLFAIHYGKRRLRMSGEAMEALELAYPGAVVTRDRGS